MFWCSEPKDGNQSEASQMLFGIRCILYYRLTPGVRFSVNQDAYDSKPVPFGLDHQAVERLAMFEHDRMQPGPEAPVEFLLAGRDHDEP